MSAVSPAEIVRAAPNFGTSYSLIAAIILVPGATAAGRIVFGDTLLIRPAPIAGVAVWRDAVRPSVALLRVND